MNRRNLFKSGLTLAAGSLLTSHGYSNNVLQIKIIRTAYDKGVTFFDTAEVYGPFECEAPTKK